MPADRCHTGRVTSRLLLATFLQIRLWSQSLGGQSSVSFLQDYHWFPLHLCSLKQGCWCWWPVLVQVYCGRARDEWAGWLWFFHLRLMLWSRWTLIKTIICFDSGCVHLQKLPFWTASLCFGFTDSHSSLSSCFLLNAWSSAQNIATPALRRLCSLQVTDRTIEKVTLHIITIALFSC